MIETAIPLRGLTEGLLPETSGAGDPLEAAVRTLAARCDGAAAEDGQGFNRLDATLGRKLALTPFGTWTPRQKRAAWSMLAKYRGQLEGLGIAYDAIPEPPVPQPSERAENWASVTTDGRFVVGFGYDPYLVDAVKRIPGRRFDPETKNWAVPASMEAIQPLLSFISEYGFDFSAALVERAGEVAGEHAERVEASRAEDAEIEVEGLGGELRPFQRAGVAYALRARRTFIADEMGLGKTVQALATLEGAGAFPALVICPASLKLNWEREAKKWLPGRTVAVVSSGKETPNLDADVLIVNYDILGKHADTLQERDNKGIVLDESQYCKNGKAKRTKLCKALAKGAEVRLLLSGTPMVNRPIELAAQLEILDRLDEFGGFWSFVRRYCDAHKERFGWNMNGASNLDELNDKLRATAYVRRRKSEVLTELPAKQRAVVPTELKSRREYERAERELVAYVGEVAANDERRVGVALAAWTAEHGREPTESEKRAVRSGVRQSAEANAERAEQLVRINALKQLAARLKMDAITEWITDFLESGEKLVVFGHHREIVDALAERFGAPSITGDTSTEARQAAVDAFQQDPDTRLIVLNLQAGGVGLTLTAASNVAFCELGWTPAAHDQAEDRCHRIGQTDSVTAYYLLAERTIDEEIHELIEAKRRVVDAATEGSAAEAGASVVSEILGRLAARAGGGKGSRKKKGKGA